MEKMQVSEEAKRLIAYRIRQGESPSRVAEDFCIMKEQAQRIAVSYYPGT